MLIQLAKFAVLSGLILFLAWLAGTGRVAYVMIMLWIAAGLAYAVLDFVDYEVVKKGKRRYAGARSAALRSWGATSPAPVSNHATRAPKRKPPTWAKKATPPPFAAEPKIPKFASISW
jgi:hypothetical protein